MADITTYKEQHVNPYEAEVKAHVPTAGDVYAESNPSFNGSDVIRLIVKDARGEWTCEDVFTGKKHRDVSDESLQRYYRWIGGDFDETVKFATMLAERTASAAEVTALITGETGPATSDTEELMATESPEHIAALLDASEKMQTRLNDIRLVARCMMEKKKRDLDMMLHDMNECLGKFQEKVDNLVKVISILNLYTGSTVDVNQIAEGEPAEPSEPLSIRQRILFMDEELCVHLDHEADYNDVPAFFEWLKQKDNRDIIVPEKRCVVCLKPKRYDMDYRSGDPEYDRVRNRWNKHTFVVLRNGDNLYWMESDDLEVWKWAFPHDDFQEKTAARLADERAWKDSIRREHGAVTYRVTKFMMFLQGLLDQRQDIIGPTDTRINLMKLEGVRLVRDDENLIGTGRKPWEQFRDEKNKLIRRGTRILYVQGEYDYRHHETSSGEFYKYYSSDYAKPELPATGLYSADEIEVVVGHRNSKPVLEKYHKLIFRYLPGDTVWNVYEGEHERKKRVAWVYNPRHVLNYDDVTLEELTGYLEDRTLRQSFANMIPVLMNIKRYKEAELRDEEAFKSLISEDIRKETGLMTSAETVNDAVAWWKEKVIFTRPLRSDDRKAWNMIRKKIMKAMNTNDNAKGKEN